MRYYLNVQFQGQRVNDISRQTIRPIFRSQAVQPADRNIQEERRIELHHGGSLNSLTTKHAYETPFIVFLENPLSDLEFLRAEGRTNTQTAKLKDAFSLFLFTKDQEVVPRINWF